MITTTQLAMCIQLLDLSSLYVTYHADYDANLEDKLILEFEVLSDELADRLSYSSKDLIVAHHLGFIEVMKLTSQEAILAEYETCLGLSSTL